MQVSNCNSNTQDEENRKYLSLFNVKLSDAQKMALIESRNLHNLILILALAI